MIHFTLFLSIFATSALAQTFIRSDGKTIAYRISNTPLTWIDAVNYCQDVGGQLAIIPTEHEQKLVEIFLEAADPGGEKWFWIGLTDLLSEGVFKWMPDFVTADYLNWGLGDPNGRHAEDFGVIMSRSKGRKWGDCYNQYSVQIYALCELDV